MFPVDSIDSSLEPLWRMAAGATAGTFATMLTHPLDVVRARLTVYVGDGTTAVRPGDVLSVVLVLFMQFSCVYRYLNSVVSRGMTVLVEVYVLESCHFVLDPLAVLLLVSSHSFPSYL